MENKTELQNQEEELKKYKGLDALKNLDGGKTLIKFARRNIEIELLWLLDNYKDANETEIRARIATMSSEFKILKAIANAESNAEVMEEEIKSLTE